MQRDAADVVKHVERRSRFGVSELSPCILMALSLRRPNSRTGLAVLVRPEGAEHVAVLEQQADGAGEAVPDAGVEPGVGVEPDQLPEKLREGAAFALRAFAEDVPSSA